MNSWVPSQRDYHGRSSFHRADRAVFAKGLRPQNAPPLSVPSPLTLYAIQIAFLIRLSNIGVFIRRKARPFGRSRSYQKRQLAVWREPIDAAEIELAARIIRTLRVHRVDHEVDISV